MQETGKPLVDVILDEAKQKGTGKWTSQSALDLGAPTPTINAAVEARIISAYKDQRVSRIKGIERTATKIRRRQSKHSSMPSAMPFSRRKYAHTHRDSHC